MLKPGVDPSSWDKFGSRPEGWPSGIRHVGGAKLNLALVRNVRTCRTDAKEEVEAGETGEDERPMRSTGGGAAERE